MSEITHRKVRKESPIEQLRRPGKAPQLSGLDVTPHEVDARPAFRKLVNSHIVLSMQRLGKTITEVIRLNTYHL